MFGSRSLLFYVTKLIQRRQGKDEQENIYWTLNHKIIFVWLLAVIMCYGKMWVLPVSIWTIILITFSSVLHAVTHELKLTTPSAFNNDKPLNENFYFGRFGFRLSRILCIIFILDSAMPLCSYQIVLIFI